MSKASYISAAAAFLLSTISSSGRSSTPALRRSSARVSFSCAAAAFFCSRRSMPARKPRPKSSRASCGDW
uniref:Uncharacterized protein n=1 Tax=Arundo donax TaxID=35708 RepID=A0A0A9EEF9_ARUDO